MNWKPTVVLAAVVAVLLGIYLAVQPPEGMTAEGVKLLGGFTAQNLVRIEIARKGEPHLSLERGNDAVGPHWRVKGQVEAPADPDAFQQMIYGLDRFSIQGRIARGRDEVRPELTGLADPRLVVTFHSVNEKATLRFGQAPPTSTAAVFYERDEDPWVYLVDAETFGAYDRTFRQLRAKQLARFTPNQVVRLDLETRFVKGQKGRPPETVYERSTFERLDREKEKGWFLVRPHKERVDDIKLQTLFADLAGFSVEEFRPPGDPKEEGWEEPQVRMGLWLHAQEKPLVVEFGAETDGKRKRFVRVAGAGDVAVIDIRRYDNLSRERNHLRSDFLFPFPRDHVRAFEVEARELGKVRIVRQETKKEGQPPQVTWEVIHPGGLPIEKPEVELFASGVFHPNHRVTAFLGPQEYPGLEPPPLTVAAETRDGGWTVLHFALAPNAAFMRREGVPELHEVRPEYVRMLRNLELNFLHKEVFNVPRESLRGIEVEFKRGPTPEALRYRLGLDEASGTWKFLDPAHARRKIDPDRVSDLLARLNYVKAQEWVGRDPETVQKNLLRNEAEAPGVVRIVWERQTDAREKALETAVLLVSENLAEKATKFLYNARLEGKPYVFRIRPEDIESLRQVPALKE
jgi:hypothetical protein